LLLSVLVQQHHRIMSQGGNGFANAVSSKHL
jgi:hypothetical protein